MKENNQNIAHHLKKARKEAGYKSASEFAKQKGLSLSTYRHHENGTRGMSIELIKHYAELLNISVASLVTLKNEELMNHKKILITQKKMMTKENQSVDFDEDLLRYLFDVIFSLSSYLITPIDKDYIIGILLSTYKKCLTTEKCPQKRIEIAKLIASALTSFLKEKNKA